MNTLKAEKRTMEVKAKRLRREGYVVGNVFGKELENSIPVQMIKGDVSKLLKTNHKGSQITLDLDGKNYDVLIKTIDFNPLAGRIDSIEFQVLVKGEKVHSVAEVILENNENVPEGVVVQIELSEIDYTALPNALVDHVTVDVSNMQVGDIVRIKDLPIASNPDVVIKNDPEAMVVSMVAVRATEEPEPAAEAEEGAEGEEAAAEE